MKITGPQSTWNQECGQRGSILIAASVFLIVGLVLLGSIKVGYMYYVKRDLQKTADLAALTGVQSVAEGCGAAKDAARALIEDGSASMQCLFWSEDKSVREDEATCTGGTTGQPHCNALSVTVSKEPLFKLPYWTTSPTISAAATAMMEQPTAVFSVGSRLLSVKNGLIGGLLTDVGLHPDLFTILDSNGVADMNMTPSGLLRELGVPSDLVASLGTKNQLADIPTFTLGEILGATIDVVGDNAALSTKINDVLGAEIGKLDSVKIPLFGNGGIFTLPVGNQLSALNAEVNAGSLVKTALVIAARASGHAVDLDVETPLFGLVKVATTVVNPPSLGVGGEGTKASNAQVQLDLSLTVPPADGDVEGAGSVLTNILGMGGVLGLGGGIVKVSIPLSIEVASSTGTLGKICDPDKGLNRKQALIAVDSAPVKVCLGRFEASESGGESKCSSTGALLNLGPVELFSKPIALDVVGKNSWPDEKYTAPPAVMPDVSERTIPDNDQSTQLSTSQISKVLVGSILSGVIDTVDRTGLAQSLVGSQGKGNSPSDIANDIQHNLDEGVRIGGVAQPVSTSLNQLSQDLSELPLGLVSATLGGVVGSVSGLVGGVTGLVGNLVNGLGNVLFGCEGILSGNYTSEKVRECRVNTVEDDVLKDGNLDSVTAGLSMAVLQPVLDPLTGVLNDLLAQLGLHLGETDVVLYSVKCGTPRLVQ